jgi:hypothetical protein
MTKFEIRRGIFNHGWDRMGTDFFNRRERRGTEQHKRGPLVGFTDFTKGNEGNEEGVVPGRT